ncbi:hypothetical protein BSQ44_19905 [Aquibium oceanicum]|uniref:Uncharacterized protein n=1 Tax=Aquibium oceanicum TaxID=1670800 RepID=A0A1L3SVD3_9HYPH|nr:hypothetical protein BSQ44_19905 [Aquibium oceanicum]
MHEPRIRIGEIVWPVAVLKVVIDLSGDRHQPRGVVSLWYDMALMIQQLRSGHEFIVEPHRARMDIMHVERIEPAVPAIVAILRIVSVNGVCIKNC